MNALIPWIPLMRHARWATGLARQGRMGAYSPHDLYALVVSLTSSLEDQGVTKPSRVLALILMGWEFMDVPAIEQVLIHLARIYPKLHIDALRPFSSQGEHWTYS